MSCSFAALVHGISHEVDPQHAPYRFYLRAMWWVTRGYLEGLLKEIALLHIFHVFSVMWGRKSFIGPVNGIDMIVVRCMSFGQRNSPFFSVKMCEVLRVQIPSTCANPP